MTTPARTSIPSTEHAHHVLGPRAEYTPTRIEMHGTDVIKEADRKGKPSDLFWVWAAATVSVLGVSYGAFTLGFGLDWTQAVLSTVFALVMSSALCGIIAIAGKRGSAPTLVLSRAAFGVTGNKIPAAVSWMLSLGWEIVSTALAALATATVFRALGWGGGTTTQAIALAAVLVLIVGGGVLGYDAVVRMQTWIMYISIVLTVIYIALTISHVDFGALNATPTGSTTAVVGAIIFLMAGTGLGWVNAAADYSRYLPRSASSLRVAGWTAIGLGAVPLVLIAYGILLAGSDQELGKAIFADPIGALAELLPTWFLVPFALVAVLGLVGTALLEIYSSGLSLLSLGMPVTRPVAAGLDGLIMAIVATYVLFFAPGDFFTQFQGFVITLAVPISAWAGIMIADIALRKRDYDEPSLFNPAGRYRAYQWRTLATFAVATAVGFGLVTNAAAGWLDWQGYLMGPIGGKEGDWAYASLGVIAALVIGFAGYSILQRRTVAAQEKDEPRVTPSLQTWGPDDLTTS
jgi:NCS1 family nucleobase:cation symporter-1